MSRRALWVIEIRERKLKFRKLPGPRTVDNKKAYWGPWSSWRIHLTSVGSQPLTQPQEERFARIWRTLSEEYRVVRYTPEGL